MPRPDRLDLSGQCVWVTGASRGIGLAICRLLAGQGASVVGFDLRSSEELTSTGAEFASLDVSSFADCEKAAKDLAARNLVPTGLVNNAGVTRDGVLWKMTESDWDTVLDVNLKGPFHMLRHAVPLMREAGRGGSIVNITSINGLRGKFGQANYAASKAGLIGLTKTAARELGRFDIRVNAVAPGMVETEMARTLPEEVRRRALEESLLQRLATPEDIADCVLFLVSPLSRHITGEVIRVDGGQYV